MKKNNRRTPKKTFGGIKRILRLVTISIIMLLLLTVIFIILFISYRPEFGQAPSREQKEGFAKTTHYHNGKFINQSQAPTDIDYWKITKEYMKGNPKREPNQNIIVEKIDPALIRNESYCTTQLIWFGHSTFLLLIDGKKILIDPMLSQSLGPHPLIGAKRFSSELPVEAEDLPYIDAVIISHDHYDHLDYRTIKKLKEKVGQFFTPLGVGNHLVRWGINADKIHELDWWQSVDFDGVKLTCTPSRHSSGRGLFDKAATLWSSWVIKGSTKNIYFSGDGGYDSHFREIGHKYGPFDVALMECGQYNDNWKSLHMTPEESVQAAIDLKGRVAIPIHWGGFSLALHDWTDPVERFLNKSIELNTPSVIPKIGQPIVLDSSNYPSQEKWWIKYLSKEDR